MPMYEFQCTKCQHEFEELMRKGGEKPRCPRCEAKEVERILSRVGFSVGGKFSASTGSGSCSGCASSSCSGCGTSS